MWMNEILSNDMKKIALKKGPVPTNIENVKSFTATFLAATLQILHTHSNKTTTRDHSSTPGPRTMRFLGLVKSSIK